MKKFIMVAAGILLIGFILGRYSAPEIEQKTPDKNNAKTSKPTIWTCSMHPEIRMKEKGKCPKCGMTLIPASQDGGEDLGERMMSMSKEAMLISEIETTPIKRRFIDLELPLVGKVDYDETRVKTIAAWMAGRLDRLFVDYTGVAVNAGDHLVEIYSPELYASQEELLQAVKAIVKLKNSESTFMRKSAKDTLAAAREKLHLLGLTDKQIKNVEKRGKPSATIEIKAPTAGIVIHKKAKEGMYVKTGTPIYTVADLSKVWLILDAYESDIAWIRYGQEVTVKTESYGDKVFKGWVSFIDPVLNPKTRTVKVRVLVDNKEGLLKPNMFARALLKTRIAANDQVITINLKGKWICPMHPEIIKNKQGKCDICNMQLVDAEKLGYSKDIAPEPPLVVPASAVLSTGKRAVVYVRIPGKDVPTFEGREIELGPRAGAYYVVRSGLQAGDDVVVHGNFKIDSSLQLLAKPSMMSPVNSGKADSAESETENITVAKAFLVQLNPLYKWYLKAQEALVNDQEKACRSALDKLFASLAKIDMKLIQGKAHLKWMKQVKSLKKALEHRAHVKGINGIRKIFLEVSKVVISIQKNFGHSGEKTHALAFCPMADGGKGAYWLQRGENVRNPYYGSAMPGCGEIKKTFSAKTEEGE